MSENLKSPTRSNGSGKNIADILDINQNYPKTARTEALRRTLLVSKLNTGRCTSPQELSDRFNSLFELAFKEGFVPNVEMLAVASGIDRKTLWDMEAKRSPGYEEYSVVVKKAKDIIASIDGTLAAENENNAAVYKFRAQNYYGMTEKQEMVITPNVDNKIPDNAEDIINSIPKLKE